MTVARHGILRVVSEEDLSLANGPMPGSRGGRRLTRGYVVGSHTSGSGSPNQGHKDPLYSVRQPGSAGRE